MPNLPEPRTVDVPFLTPDDVALYLGVSPSRVRQLMQAGQLPHVRRGRLYLVPFAAWQAYVDALTTQANAAVKVAPAPEAPHA